VALEGDRKRQQKRSIGNEANIDAQTFPNSLTGIWVTLTEFRKETRAVLPQLALYPRGIIAKKLTVQAGFAGTGTGRKSTQKMQIQVRLDLSNLDTGTAPIHIGQSFGKP
jgi:hypothetical protein